MSESFDNRFNNNSQNSSDSDMQNVNNYERENHQESRDNESVTASVNDQETAQAPPAIPEKRSSDEERVDVDSYVNALDNQLKTVSDAPDQSSADVSKDNDEKFNEEIQRKIDAVKDFAFCQKKVSFPFCQKKYKEIPVYPYVAALTGHRDAIITDAVKQTAKKQLRSLAKAWDKACKGRSWLIIPKKTAPLIVLIGLGDGKSGEKWAEIAAELRDKDKYNIKVVAVAGMPLKDIVNILSKHRNILSQDKDFLDAKKSFDFILEKADGLIELPYEQDVKEYIKLYEDLEMNCTGDNAAHSEKLFQILFNESKAFQDIQYKEYRKFMCTHSHVLLALTENATSWENANLAGIDINELSSNSSDNRIPKDSIINPYKEKIEAREKLKALNNRITELKNQGIQTETFEEMVDSFKNLASGLFKISAKSIPRTNAMIFYKLLGNVDSALIPAKQKINGISFTSIGPAVCIHTKRSAPDAETENAQNSNVDVTILVKDQPNDVSADLIMKINWDNKKISRFDEIREVISICGLINKRLYKERQFSQKPDVSEESVIKDFLEAQSSDNQDLNVDIKSVDKETLSLIKHYNIAKNLSKECYKWMKYWAKRFAFVAIFFLSLLGVGNVFNDKIVVDLSNYGIALLGGVIFLYFLLSRPHQYYHYYDALANGLKVQIFWNLAGVNEDAPGQFYLHQINKIAWLRVALNGLLATTTSTSNIKKEIDENSLNDYKLIKKYWIDSMVNQIAGKTDFTRTERFFENGLRYLSPARGFIAGIGYVFLNSIWEQNPALNIILGIFSCILLIVFSVIAVYNAYRGFSLKELDIKRRRQLLYPYRRAQLLYGIKLNYWENSQISLQKDQAPQYDINEESSDRKVINNSYQECQKILEDLGRIELAINAEWLLGLRDRKFRLSDAKDGVELQSYKYKEKKKNNDAEFKRA